jgi:hypothetical protein
MRKIVIMTAVALICAGPAFAGPKDKSANTLIGPQALAGNATVANSTTAFGYKSAGCKVQLQAKGLLGTTDGEIIMCIAEADVISPPSIGAPGAGNGVLLLGEVKKGGLKIKADLHDVLCGSGAAIQFNGNMRCYKDDLAYRTGGWVTACTSVAGSIPIPNQNPDPVKLKVNDTENVVVGICQNLTTLGARLPAPSSTLIAVQGALVNAAP